MLTPPVDPAQALGKLLGLSKVTYFRADDFKMVRDSAFTHDPHRGSLTPAQFLRFRDLWDAAEMQLFFEKFLDRVEAGHVAHNMEKLVPHNSLSNPKESDEGEDD